MNGNATKIDLVKLFFYLLKKSWILIICGVIGFCVSFWNTAYRQTDTYTASGTMYVYNGNPNLVNYQYTSTSDLNSAVQLMNTYMVVIKSNKVLDVVAERLAPDYPYITPAYISASLSMGSVAQTGVMQIRCRTDEAQKSSDICNAVLDVAPAEIIRVVGAGNIEIVDYATPPRFPDARGTMRKGMIGALAGMVAAGAVLVLLFLFMQKIESARELTEAYTPPVLSEIRRDKKEDVDPASFLLNKDSPMDKMESYAKLRMNLFYTLVGKKNHTIMVTSGISGEGKSTIAASLAVSCAMSDRKVLLIDADMRRACQGEMFHYDREEYNGLSDVLVGNAQWHDTLLVDETNGLDILPAGHLPPNPAELLESDTMKNLLEEMSKEYDLILLDSPPLNIVSDPLALAPVIAGALFVVRQGFSDHREIRKALISAEMGGLEILGFVFYGENLRQGNYYNRKYYRGYYHKYDHRYDTRGKAQDNHRENEKEESNQEGKTIR